MKPIIAIASLASCKGCQVAILDLGERFLGLAEKIIIDDFALLEEKRESKKFDIVFIEGSPISLEDQKRLKKLRKKSKILVAIGACACLGGVQEIKNYQNKNEKNRYAYKNIERINNPDIKPLRELVQVDLEIPGCPINKNEFFELIKKLLLYYQTNQIPKIAQRPVCYECQLKQNECLLQKDKPCLGPIILGGCGAICPTNKFACDGCRGPLKGVDPQNIGKLLREKLTDKEIELITERFGLKNERRY